MAAAFRLPVLLLFFGFAVFTGLLAGALPAWVLSSFKPAEILKNIGLNRLFGNLNLRRSLIVFQLVLSLVTCIFLLSFYRQFEHMGRKADYDHRTANVMSIPLNGAEAPLLQRELANLGAVRRTASASANIGRRNDNSINVNDTRLNYWAADTGIVSLLKLQLVAGRNNVQPNEALINEKAVAALGYKRPDDALGQSVRVNDSTQMTIAGVLRDFMYENVGRNLAPLIIANEGTPQRYLLVQTQGNRAQSARLANEVWSGLYPAQAFEFSWLDEDIRQRNSQADTVSQISYLAFMTIVIAALGLLAMVIYTTETRRREISIRKVMGANVRHLLWLLSKGFVKLLIIAGGIALPLGYVLSALFLQNFADRASIGIGSLLLCLGHHAAHCTQRRAVANMAGGISESGRQSPK
ncbi:hypothetical protein MKQ70_30355 [Chitinophaga sedimenti]|uniref:ABC transporter permease n=1 Tax=Chitinophaga sedimenti TaxID=2033606 RepID=UPI00200625CD|nr:FtsX-like permease family protein [Chitinophaga sedimenti]MCK7559048.1 hypothetical protein [Chitinophaga sedimenti]